MDALRIDRSFQPRKCGVDSDQARRYALALEAGSTFPPIKVATIGRINYVVDGFHRVAAYRLVGRKVITADVATMNRRMATAVAIDANAANGLPFCVEDRHRIFRRYCEEGLHLVDNGSPKSLRDISRDLQGALGRRLSATTVSKYLEQFAASRLPAEPDGYDDRLEPPALTPKEERYHMSLLDEASQHIDEAVGFYNCLEDDDYKHMLRDKFREALERLGGNPDEPAYNPLNI